MYVEETVVNGRLYEDNTLFMGAVKVTLPDVNYLTQTLKGIGIPGNIEYSIPGQIDAMTLSIDFQTFSREQIKLSEPRRHNLTLLVSQQGEDTAAGVLSYSAVKHVFIVTPKSDKGGGVEPATPSNGSGEYAVRYWATYINNERVREIDPLNSIFYVNGTDYMAQVRKALGM